MFSHLETNIVIVSKDSSKVLKLFFNTKTNYDFFIINTIPNNNFS